MGKRGPIADTPETRRLKGRRVGAAAKRSSTPRYYTPRMPKTLIPAAQAYWRDIVPKLAARGNLLPVHAVELGALCLYLARIDEAEADVTARGIMAPSARGVALNRSVQASRDYQARVSILSQKFGLTPADAGRIEYPDEPSRRDPLDELLDDFLGPHPVSTLKDSRLFLATS